MNASVGQMGKSTKRKKPKLPRDMNALAAILRRAGVFKDRKKEAAKKACRGPENCG